MVIEGERFETIQRELAKIQAIVDRVQEVRRGDEYETRQYLPGTLMTDLRGGDVAPTPLPHLRTARPGRGQHRHRRPPPVADNGAADASLAGLSILVVDDDLGVCQSLAELLRHQGCEAGIATTAAEALRVLAERSFDLVLSDVVMPDMDGYDLYMELKERRPELPVILMTGYLYDRDHVIKRSKLAGLDNRRAVQETDRSRASQGHHPRELPTQGGGHAWRPQRRGTEPDGFVNVTRRTSRPHTSVPGRTSSCSARSEPAPT